jgi:hypothetical protein
MEALTQSGHVSPEIAKLHRRRRKKFQHKNKINSLRIQLCVISSFNNIVNNSTNVLTGLSSYNK